jgi:hypothetical protein
MHFIAFGEVVIGEGLHVRCAIEAPTIYRPGCMIVESYLGNVYDLREGEIQNHPRKF